MAELTRPLQQVEKPESYFSTHIRPMLRQWPVRLILVQLGIELFLPIILYVAPIPASADFLFDIIAVLPMMLSLLYMLARDRIPGVVLLILAITLIWGMIALFEGQSVAATAWGWWKFFMYPFVGLFAYLTVKWPKGFADWWLKFLIGLMAFEVAVQIVQQVTGFGFIDDRAGTFARNGVGPQNLFNWLVISLAFGRWIASRQWKLLLITLLLGLVASVINGTKFYLPSIAFLGIGAVGLQLISGGKLKHLLSFLVVFTILAAAFLPIYNYFVEQNGGTKLQEYFEPTRLESYLFNDGKGDRDGKYNLGRMLSVTYGLQIIQRDPTTLLFGMGLGARSHSRGLGITGTGLENDLYGSATGTGLLTRIQEQGLVGLAVLWLFFLWVAWRMYRDAKTHDDEGLRAVEYGLILFTFYWPLWLWYINPWIYGVMMILYWTLLGYVFSDMNRRRRAEQRLVARRRAMANVISAPATDSRPPTVTPLTANGHGPRPVDAAEPPLL